ncbi:MAG: sulfite exporter TauE/SafE family protein [Candidatus Bipolaricaulota bacterium]|nr:sulfite exporter TauE/SafE family protein [Candidatus Bipolaricaulota bacterium]
MTWELFLIFALLAFVAEYIDSSLGMGYGTTLTPLLLLWGFTPLQIVPIVLLSEFITGLVAAGFHHTYQNVSFRRDSLDSKVALTLALIGIVGTIIAVSIAVRLPTWVIKIYIGVLVLALGIFVLVTPSGSQRFSWGRLVGIGLLSSFNKGLSGGGYGPIITAGQMLAGLNPKAAVGITSLAEGVVSLVGVLMYWLTVSTIEWHLALPILVGAVVSTPLAAFTVHKLPVRTLKMLIALLAITLGIVTLVRATS